MSPTDAGRAAPGVQKMTPSEAFVETMVAQGVDTMFGIMGSAFMDAMDIFAPAGIRLIPVVHEQGAGQLADGYARVSGRHGVLIGQNGPGISSCVTAIAAACGAHSPVIIVTPETGSMGMGLGGFQEAHQLPMFQEFIKYQGQVVNPKRTAEFTARCFDRAISEMGPTQLNIPRDYFYGEVSCEIPRSMRVDRGSGPRMPRSSRSRPTTPTWAWSRRSAWASTAMPSRRPRPCWRASVARCWPAMPARPSARPPSPPRRRPGNKPWTPGPTRPTPSAWA